MKNQTPAVQAAAAAPNAAEQRNERQHLPHSPARQPPPAAAGNTRISQESIDLEKEIDRIIAKTDPKNAKELIQKNPKFRNRFLWGTSWKQAVIGYADVRRVLGEPFFSRVNKVPKSFTFTSKREVMGMKMIVDTVVSQSNGIAHPFDDDKLFVVRIFDDWSVKRNGKSTEIVEYRRYVSNDDNDPLRYLRAVVVEGLDLMEMRAVCRQCQAYSKYEKQVGFVCPQCKTVVDATYQRWLDSQTNEHPELD